MALRKQQQQQSHSLYPNDIYDLALRKQQQQPSYPVYPTTLKVIARGLGRVRCRQTISPAQEIESLILMRPQLYMH